jgi:hypothetical protein
MSDKTLKECVVLKYKSELTSSESIVHMKVLIR